jgi:lipopolysaccharide transport system ATP-binding protein
MDSEVVLKVENLSKKFSRSLRRGLAYGTLDVARSFFGLSVPTGRLRKSEFWALHDINFTIKRGEAVGIIGVNGAGKSTLLRLITGIFPPDRGSITYRGKIGSLIAVGAGFHPHMTGRENIYLNATILGMTKEEIDSNYDSIIEFADIGEFLDAPVSNYSSGMRVRLGFAIAVHSQPDILLVDEILSVGDLGFRNKSLRRMAQFRQQANALLFVSHDIEQIRLLCSRVIIMSGGEVVFDGDTQEGIVKYEELSRDIRVENLHQESKIQRENMIRSESDIETLNVLDIGTHDKTGENTDRIGLKDPVNIYCDFQLNKKVDGLSFYISVNRDDSELKVINVVSNATKKHLFRDLEPGKYRINLHLEHHHLNPGVYNIGVGFRNDLTFETYQKLYSNIAFKVESDGLVMERGVINVNDDWKLDRI